MKIAFLITKFTPIVGGGESHIELVAEQLHRRGHEVHVITSKHSERNKNSTAYTIHEIDGLADANISFSAINAIHPILKESFDILHIINFEALFYYQLLKIKHPATKVIFSTHNTPHLGQRIFGGFSDYNLERANVLALLKTIKIDHFIANSNAFVQALHDLGIAKDEMTHIRFGIDLNTFKPNASVQKKSTVDILCTSRFAQRKGIEFLIDALNYLPNNYHLYLTGSGSIHEPHTHQRLLAMTGRFQGQIHLADTRKETSELAALYQSCAVFVMPSMREGFGLAALEAMACHIPVVATNVQGLVEFVRHEKTGLLVSYGNSLQLANAIERIVNDAHLRKQIVDNADQMVHTSFNIASMIDAYETTYRQAIGSLAQTQNNNTRDTYKRTDQWNLGNLFIKRSSRQNNR